MFSYPLTVAYGRDGSTRPCWSEEEYKAALAEGCLEEKPEPVVEPAPEMIAEPVEDQPAKRGPGRPRRTQQEA